MPKPPLTRAKRSPDAAARLLGAPRYASPRIAEEERKKRPTTSEPTNLAAATVAMHGAAVTAREAVRTTRRTAVRTGLRPTLSLREPTIGARTISAHAEQLPRRDPRTVARSVPSASLRYGVGARATRETLRTKMKATAWSGRSGFPGTATSSAAASMRGLRAARPPPPRSASAGRLHAVRAWTRVGCDGRRQGAHTADAAAQSSSTVHVRIAG